MERDRRGFERIPILGSLRGEVMVYQSVAIQDVSLHGLTIETSFPLHLDSLHDLQFTLGAVSIAVKGRVIHSAIADVDHDVVTYRSGFEFVDPPEPVTTAIAEFTATTKAQRDGA
jgi:hypothetical protein